MPDGNIRARTRSSPGRGRRIYPKHTPYQAFFKVRVRPVPEIAEVMHRRLDASMRTTRDLFERCIQLDRSLPDEAHLYSLNVSEPGWLADVVATAISLPLTERHSLLLLTNPQERLKEKSIGCLLRNSTH